MIRIAVPVFVAIGVLLGAAFPLDLQTLPDNAWTRLSNMTYQIGRTGFYEYRAWCNMKWDADSGRILFWEGLDTGSYSIYANALYSLDPAAEKVRLISYSSYWVGNGNQFTPGALPVTPHPRHCYGAFEYVRKMHRLYMGFGACSGSSNCENTHVWKYDPSADLWTECAPVWSSYNYDQNFIHFRGSDTLWILGPNSGGWVHLYAFNLVSENSFTDVPYGIPTFAAYDGMTAVDTVRQNALFSTSAGFYLFNPVARTLSQLANAPSGISGGVAAIAYVQKHDLFFIHDWARGTDWSFNPSDQAWDSLATADSPVDASGMGQNSRHRNIVYDPVNDLVVVHGTDGFRVIRVNPPALASRGPAGAARTAPLIGVSPNPSNGVSQIRVRGFKAGDRLSVFSLDGRCVSDLTPALTNDAAVWHAGGLPAGVYLVRLESDAGIRCVETVLIR